MTQWTLVRRAQNGSTEAWSTLCAKYRPPLLKWLRCQPRRRFGLDPDDLVNGFMGYKMPEQVLRTVTPDKGKFRSFVVTCLRYYVRDELAKIDAKIRGGGHPHQSIEETGGDGRPLVQPVSPDAGADEEFDRAWGLTILRNAIERLEDELNRKGGVYLSLWRRLEPLLYEEEGAPGYDKIGNEFEMRPAAVYQAACRLRKRLKALIQEEVRETVSSPEEFREELKHFIALLGRPCRPPTSS